MIRLKDGLVRRSSSIGGLYNQHIISFLDDSNAILIISGERDSIGKILYGNEEAEYSLKAFGSSLVGNSIINFIPAPYDIPHEQYLMNFIVSSSSTALNKPNSLFLVDYRGFIVECYL